MSSAVSSALATPSSSSCATADFTKFPTGNDAACAVGSISGIPSNTSTILSSCCKSAPVEQFNGECGYYCLSIEQSVADLQKCFVEGGVSPSTVFCTGNNTATATGKPSSSASRSGSGSPTTGASRASGGGSSGSTTTPSGPAKSTGAAPAGFAPQSVSKAGLGVMCMIVVSALAGAVL
ncbi:uncharacterized protein K460DRAFT_347229 [Cucurbitaria berberidis CBS 394.84]|uniref:Uncharacterized protein n=1 Tax=Cucurbitaria berberidis CBS 394.84 TaxID=1168544 RepID=A0A9P4L3X9_9PLEO|nr:uncharacterized protein K460DRAFT_347229 [Cucurbitaria berberidis CBS 394.84]KAF1840860.1 hypothetical protein K460DRAFT_347229 [Cucurbitaria berberidis CBS 394.84]